MNEQLFKEEHLYLIKEIGISPLATQRSLSSKLDISLGKTNYLLKELLKRGIVSIRNFSKNEDKLKKTSYILTKKGIEQRLHLTYHFLKRKEADYNRIKKEWIKIKKNHKFQIN